MQSTDINIGGDDRGYYMRLKEWGDEHTGTNRAYQTISKNARRGREGSE